MAISQITTQSLGQTEPLNKITLTNADKITYAADLIPSESDPTHGYSTDAKIIMLQGQNTYFIRFKIKRMKPYDQAQYPGLDQGNLNLDYDIYLGNYTEGTLTLIQQLKNNIQVSSGQGSTDVSDYQFIDLVFNINTNNINCIYIQLSPKMYDYQHSKTDNPRATWLTDNDNLNIYLFTVNNLINNITAIKIGVQAQPGRLIILNKQPVRIGRSGIYENNGGNIKIKYFSIIPTMTGDDTFKIPDFIFDYVKQQEG